MSSFFLFFFALFPHLYRCGHIEGYIFGLFDDSPLYRFPHLYRCGHIEGVVCEAVEGGCGFHFRIFIDAATLKEVFAYEVVDELGGISASL